MIETYFNKQVWMARMALWERQAGYRAVVSSYLTFAVESVVDQTSGKFDNVILM